MTRFILSLAIASLMAISFTSPAKALSLTECALGLLPEGVSCEAPTVGDGNGGIVQIERVPADTEVADKMAKIQGKLEDRFGYKKANRIMSRIGARLKSHLEDRFGEDMPAMVLKTRNGPDVGNEGPNGNGRPGPDRNGSRL